MRFKYCRLTMLPPATNRGLIISWRKRWDSNPRYDGSHTRFPSVLLQPLGHSSVHLSLYPVLNITSKIALLWLFLPPQSPYNRINAYSPTSHPTARRYQTVWIWRHRALRPQQGGFDGAERRIHRHHGTLGLRQDNSTERHRPARPSHGWRVLPR